MSGPILKLSLKLFRSTPAERRSRVRHRSTRTGRCRPVQTPGAVAPWPARIWDVSGGGVALILDRRFEAGTLLMIECPDDNGTATDRLLARVLHALELRDNRWFLGCRLMDELEEEEVCVWARPAA